MLSNMAVCVWQKIQKYDKTFYAWIIPKIIKEMKRRETQKQTNKQMHGMFWYIHFLMINFSICFSPTDEMIRWFGCRGFDTFYCCYCFVVKSEKNERTSKRDTKMKKKFAQTKMVPFQFCYFSFTVNKKTKSLIEFLCCYLDFFFFSFFVRSKKVFYENMCSNFFPHKVLQIF